MHFINAATWSWNGKNSNLSAFREAFFKTYYGNTAIDMDKLFELLNHGAYYYAGPWNEMYGIMEQSERHIYRTFPVAMPSNMILTGIYNTRKK